MSLDPKFIGEPLDKKLIVSEKIKDKVKLYLAEIGERIFDFKKHSIIAKEVIQIDTKGRGLDIEKRNNNFQLIFYGLNSALSYITPNPKMEDYQIVRNEIHKDMNEQEAKLILSHHLSEKEQWILVRRKISPEIAKLLGAEVDIQRGLIVGRSLMTKDGEPMGGVYYPIFGYESVVIAKIIK